MQGARAKAEIVATGDPKAGLAAFRWDVPDGDHELGRFPGGRGCLRLDFQRRRSRRLRDEARSRRPATSSTSSTTTGCALPGAEGDRTHARSGSYADPEGELLGRSHPPRALQARRSCDRAEPAAGREPPARHPGQPGRRAQVRSDVPSDKPDSSKEAACG